MSPHVQMLCSGMGGAAIMLGIIALIDRRPAISALAFLHAALLIAMVVRP
jgi:hypothetical protein